MLDWLQLMAWRVHWWSCLISIPHPMAPWESLQCSEMRHSHWSQGFTIIAFTLEIREINEVQATVSDVLTQFIKVYPSSQLNSMYSYCIKMSGDKKALSS